LALGSTVGELEQRLSLREYWEWQEFFRLEPPIGERVDLMGALVASILANIHRKQGASQIEIDDFMLVSQQMRQEYAPPETPEEYAENHLKEFILSIGGRIDER
jgi:hypothetical protein